ncbi:uncharacterized protein LOC110978919 [Acanthaster planci]|uniref:Uncharacterized protein LOC110978919 n=1 Tax=Acanthaster planci TaxID=133434 RepID=A0A8B7Y9N3_ACAPL|nr:uncharacterized protein LOC110978919 [Acanthaster planci]
MTEVDVPFYGSHLKVQHLHQFDNMPDEDEVRSIAGPFITGPNDDDADLEGEIARCQGLDLEGLFGGTIPKIPDAFYAKNDGLKADEASFPDCSSSGKAESTQEVVHVQGNGVPVSYEVRGLQQHEMPVIGTHIDPRIMPGFKYRVRILGNEATEVTPAAPRYQFRGEALHLLRVGQGYGKRLTFTADSLNENTNYFWSDSIPTGYGFAIVAVHAGDELVMTDLARRPIGNGTVEEASPCQVELGTETLVDQDAARNRETIVKRVSVIMKVRLRYTCERHGIRSIRADETVIVRGVARVIKQAGHNKAYTKCIEELELPHLGECLLYLR